jgi:hypothetical protein
MDLDASLYPDQEVPPSRLEDPGAKADYLHRVCSAMDFQIFPEPATLEALAEWEDIFDRYPLPASPAYRALRAWFGWAPVTMPRGLPASRPRYLALDAAEGRGLDPCESAI